MSIQKTLIFLKPDVYEKNIIGKVISEIEEQKRYKILEMKMVRLNQTQAENFYKVHREKPFFKDLVKYVCRGPIVPILIEGEDAIKEMRKLMGATNPIDAKKDTIRGKFGESLDANVVHGSDSEESAKIEIPFFFG
jgi:nucleoside-diphosphate kinase